LSASTIGVIPRATIGFSHPLETKTAFVTKKLCPHNGREGISGADIAEHAGNGDLGSAVRDFVESNYGRDAYEVAKDVVQEIGDSMMRDGDN
jgi:hypothetical protein